MGSAGEQNSPTSSAPSARAFSPRTWGFRTAAAGARPGSGAKKSRCWPGSGQRGTRGSSRGATFARRSTCLRHCPGRGAERAHLILLGRGEQAKPCKAPAEEVSPNLRRLVENVGPGPAYLLGRRWDYLAWNRSFEAVFGWEPGPDPLTRNHVWLWFMDPSRRSLCSGDWAASARLLVAKFRGDIAKNIGDPAFEELISVLNASSPEFRKLWKRHEVAGSGDGHKELTHPVAGPLAFDHAVFHHGESGEQRLILYTPSCEHDTRAKLARLLGDEDADPRELEVALAVG
jgi:hypothetical protein